MSEINFPDNFTSNLSILSENSAYNDSYAAKVQGKSGFHRIRNLQSGKSPIFALQK